MTFYSYAQNLEDVVLWRALRHVREGFYIDVGANDPVEHSVTKAFYDAGWRGISIEPAEAFFKRLQAARPRDINLRRIAAAQEGVLTFFDVANTGLSTTEAQIAEYHRAQGHQVTKASVPATTLRQICDEYVTGDVHFLKIDVEGGTRSVLEGMDFTRVRPWVVVVEATMPMTQIPTHHEWEDLLLSGRYRFIYADGLNRFYVAEERPELNAAFATPPNIFDDYQLIGHHDAIVRSHEAEQHAHEAAKLCDALSLQIARNRDAEKRAYEAVITRDASLAEAAKLCDALSLQIARNRDAEERAYEAAVAAGRLEQARAREADVSAVVFKRLDEREALLQATFASTSWRLSTPLRALGRALRNQPEPEPLRATRRPPRPTFFIECTHTFHSELNTGIQRVVRNILRNAPAVAAERGFDAVAVIASGDRFEIADPAIVLADKQEASTKPVEPVPPPDPSQVLAPGLNWRGRLYYGLRPAWRRLQRVLATLFPFPTARRFIYAPPSEPGFAGCIALPFRVARRILRRSAPPQPRAPVTTLDDYDRLDGSILLLLDSSWTVPIWPGTHRFKERGGRVVGVIYDLIPVTHSHTCVPELIAAFEAWLAEHFRTTDGFVCISKSIADGVADYIETEGISGSRLTQAPIGYFHLGSELDFITSADAVRENISAIFQPNRHSFIQVGSIEPRKNHAFVLDAFDRFWAEGGTGALVIIGRQGWKTEEFLGRVAQHPQLGRQLFILRDATDAELDFCYRHASALVIASEVEGFGLPVVEAFQRGLSVLCSDIPVFREIAEGKAGFFSLNDPSALTADLRNFCRDRPLDQRLRREPQPWITWRQSTEQLIDASLRMINAPRTPNV